MNIDFEILSQPNKVEIGVYGVDIELNGTSQQKLDTMRVRSRARNVRTSTDAILDKTLKNDVMETPTAKNSSARQTFIRRLNPMVSFFKNP